MVFIGRTYWIYNSRNYMSLVGMLIEDTACLIYNSRNYMSLVGKSIIKRDIE